MFAAGLIAIALHQEAVLFKFQPKVGEKYRFEMTMEDEAGKSEVPQGAKAFTIFKVAGVRDGKYTIHQTVEIIPFGAPTVAALFGTYRVDSQMNTEIVETAEPFTPDGAGDGEAVSTIMNGCFGLFYSPSPVKPSEEWKAPFDMIPAVKKYLPTVPPESNPQYEGTNDRRFVLEKLDAKAGYFKSQINCVVNISGEDKSGHRQVHIDQVCSQTTTVDRATGMPTKLDRKLKLSIKSGEKSSSIAGTVHLIRVP